MPYIFKATTQDGFSFKILSELLQNTIKIACFDVDNDGIRLRMVDSRRRILVDVNLPSEKFNIYEKHTNQTLNLGVNLSHLHRMLRSIKKKDTIQLCIDSNEPNHLIIMTYPQENNRISKSTVMVQKIQTTHISIPDGYDGPVHVPSGEYQRAIKDMMTVGSKLSVKMRKHSLTICASADGVYTREVDFGELTNQTDIQYVDEFDMENITRTLKISGLSSRLLVYGKKELPLLIKSDVGSIGEIRIFIKSNAQIAMDESR